MLQRHACEHCCTPAGESEREFEGVRGKRLRGGMEAESPGNCCCRGTQAELLGATDSVEQRHEQ